MYPPHQITSPTPPLCIHTTDFIYNIPYYSLNTPTSPLWGTVWQILFYIAFYFEDLQIERYTHHHHHRSYTAMSIITNHPTNIWLQPPLTLSINTISPILLLFGHFPSSTRTTITTPPTTLTTITTQPTTITPISSLELFDNVYSARWPRVWPLHIS